VKRFLLVLCCLMALGFYGCSSMNQTNRFAVMPQAETTPAPELTAPPVMTATPESTQEPVVQLVVAPTDAADEVTLPGNKLPATDTAAPTETPTPTPEGSPGGFNG